MASRSSIISVTISGSAVVRSTPATYYGITVRETGGVAVAKVRVWDNASAASGVLLETIGLPAGGSASFQYAAEDASGGLRAANGVYVEVVSGAVEGSVRVS